MKGIEGLPLKYIVIILVAAIVIGVAFSVVSTFTGTAGTSGAQLEDTLEGSFNQTASNTCTRLGGTYTLNTTSNTYSCVY